MNSERIKEIQEQTAYPESISVMLALKQVWNECEQDKSFIEKLKESNDLQTAKEFFIKNNFDYFTPEQLNVIGKTMRDYLDQALNQHS